jgi:hypothetical protein
MTGKFLTPGEIADLKRSQDKTNSLQKREGTVKFHTNLIVCGCPDPNCGGWHTVVKERPLPSESLVKEILKADNKRPKTKSRRRT